MSWGGENSTTDEKQFQSSLYATSHVSYQELTIVSMLSIYDMLQNGVYQSKE